MRRKKYVSLLLASIIFIMTWTQSLEASAFADSSEPSRVINLVYDDSSSMIIDDYSHEQVDRWCQAKYAMEVFAAMLGNKDSLNIYCMSDFSNKSSAGAHLRLDGSSGSSKNVQLVHDMLTPALQTPFNAVEKAYSDLLQNEADDKWLVVLTDGQFQGAPSLNDYFAKKDKSVNVVFVAMDKGADSIKQDEGNGVFFYQADNSSKILGTITDASTRIFNSHKLSLSKDNSFSFDLPMSELVVFAQGQSVKIYDITGPSEACLSSASEVNVRYCEKPSSDSYTSSANVIDKNLVGSISTFSGDYDVGEYQLNVENADTVEIYYKPNISIALVLRDKGGNEVTELKKLEAGEYTVDFRLVKNGTNEQVTESKLLGNLKYFATVHNNDEDFGEITQGEKIALKEGSVQINAHATYLDYNTVTTVMEYKVWRNKNVEFSFPNDNPTYEVTKDGVETGVPFKVYVTLEGQEITSEQWALFQIPEIEFLNSGGLFNKGDEPSIFTEAVVEKSGEPGVFLVYPQVRKGGPKQTGITYGDAQFRILYNSTVEDELWSGTAEGTIKTTDGRSLTDRIWDLIVLAIVVGMILFFLIGYIAKRRFPRGMKSKPRVICRPLARTRAPVIQNFGSFKKKPSSRLLPYAAERGTMSIAPGGIGPKLSLKAKSRSSVYLMNAEQLAGDKNLRINGATIMPETKKPIVIPASSIVTWSDALTAYECHFNE